MILEMQVRCDDRSSRMYSCRRGSRRSGRRLLVDLLYSCPTTGPQRDICRTAQQQRKGVVPGTTARRRVPDQMDVKWFRLLLLPMAWPRPCSRTSPWILLRDRILTLRNSTGIRIRYGCRRLRVRHASAENCQTYNVHDTTGRNHHKPSACTQHGRLRTCVCKRRENSSASMVGATRW